MGTHVNGRNLHDKAFWPVYARCEELGLPLFLHNLYPFGAERLKDFFMINVLGNPYEDGVAAASLVYGGVLDAFPKLEVYLAHGGGTFPWLIGRFDYAAGYNPALKHMKQPPSAYLKRFYYDVIVFNAQIMRDLIDLVGVERIVMGTDFPQAMAVNQPVDFVESVPRPLREREMILSLNAQRMLRLEPVLRGAGMSDKRTEMNDRAPAAAMRWACVARRRRMRAGSCGDRVRGGHYEQDIRRHDGESPVLCVAELQGHARFLRQSFRHARRMGRRHEVPARLRIGRRAEQLLPDSGKAGRAADGRAFRIRPPGLLEACRRVEGRATAATHH
jgi:hypothetical protein